MHHSTGLHRPWRNRGRSPQLRSLGRIKHPVLLPGGADRVLAGLDGNCPRARRPGSNPAISENNLAPWTSFLCLLRGNKGLLFWANTKSPGSKVSCLKFVRSICRCWDIQDAESISLRIVSDIRPKRTYIYIYTATPPYIILMRPSYHLYFPDTRFLNMGFFSILKENLLLTPLDHGLVHRQISCDRPRIRRKAWTIRRALSTLRCVSFLQRLWVSSAATSLCCIHRFLIWSLFRVKSKNTCEIVLPARSMESTWKNM